MKEVEIQDVLLKSYFEKGHRYGCPHYQGMGLTECDVMTISKAGFVHEFEIKLSRSDFKAEFRNKKSKHEELKGVECTRTYNEWIAGSETGNRYTVIIKPNYFFFVCPEGLIKIEEVPEYSGLIYIPRLIPSEIIIVKKAPRLHTLKATEDIYKTMLRILSTRAIFGSSYMTYKRNKSIAGFEKQNNSN